jgi:hypothetical protein
MKPAYVICITAFLALTCMASAVTAGTVTHHYSFSPPEITDNSEGSQIVLENTRNLGLPGEPQLPTFGVILLLPPGEGIVSARIIPGPETVLPGTYLIAPTQREYPLNYVGPYEPIPPNPEIYNSDTPYPQNAITHTSTQFYRGYSIGYASVVPVVYHPQSGQVSYYSDVEVVFETASTPKASHALNAMLRSDGQTIAYLASIVQNIESVSAYPSVDQTDEIPVDYVIITTNEFVTDFQTLANFKNRRGVQTIIETVENIGATQPGQDTQDKIRHYITGAYTQYGASYILLAGDVELVPHRNLYAEAYGYTDDIAADLYYGGLDGTWNDDGDARWGEPGEDDLIPEVSVGRAAIDSHTEAMNFINKQIMYQQSPVVADCNKALFAGELLWSDVYCQWTFGGTYKDEIRLGSSNFGYTTVGFPPAFQNTTLYDLSICPSSWTALGNLLPLLNSGFNMVNHLGHANVTYALRFNNADITDANFTNNGVNHGFWIGYTQGCYCGSFDNRNESGGTTDDCILETFTTIAHGPVCFIGNARYGWGQHNSTDGSSQYFDRQFFDAVFGENLTRIGPAEDDSKVDNIWSIDYQANRWCYYELNLFGDPELDFWTNTPQTLTADFPGAYVIGQDTFRVTVPGVEGAVVALSFDGSLVGRGITGSGGQADVVLDSPPNDPGTMGIVIVAHDYLEYSDNVQVIPPEGPYVVYRSYILDDAAGNGDGLLDFGEAISLSVTMENVGNDDAEDITVLLQSDDPYITITDNTAAYGTILAHTQGSIADGFAFFVASNIPDHHVVSFDLTATSSTLDEWTDDFSIIAHAPDVDILAFEIDDATGNNNGRLDPDEAATIIVTLDNGGSAEVVDMTGALTSDYPHMTITQDMATLTLLPANGNGILAPAFGVQVSPAAPAFSRAVFYLNLAGVREYSRSLLYETTVGGYCHDVEGGASSWEHAVLTPGWTDQWHISTESCNSPSHAWKCGDTGTGTYANLVDAVLTSPTITIPNNTKLNFWQWMEAEVSGYYPDSAYDGGTIEISANGGPWQILTPEGGYTHHIRHSAGGGNPYSGPFPGGTPCFSGQIDWEQVAVNLYSYSGNVQLRFRFGSDQGTAREGWYIDDVEITLTDDLAPPVNLSGSLVGTNAHLEWNSPGVDGLQGYDIYRNSSLIASQVQSLHFDDNLENLPQEIYTYTITALYDAGESAFTDPAIIDFTGSLNPVEYLVVTRLGPNIVLTWSAVPTASGYNVYRGSNPDASPAEMTLIASPTDPTYLDSNILNGSDASVFYVVTAIR